MLKWKRAYRIFKLVPIGGFILIYLSFNQSAYSKECNQYYQNTAPQILNPNILVTSICFNGFSNGYAHELRTPIWSAEYLTRKRLKIADTLGRVEQFHEESSLPNNSRTELSEFKVYGYDRGHLAPHHDMANIDSQYDSFSLANVVLQNSKHNRKYWADIERLTRYQVYRHDEAYVVTGIIVNNAEFSDTGLIIPKYLFKAVYLPKLQQAGVYLSANSEKHDTKVISINELQKLAQIDVMPSLSSKIKQQKMLLPIQTSRPEIANEKSTSNGIDENKIDDEVGSVLSKLLVFFKELLQAIQSLFV